VGTRSSVSGGEEAFGFRCRENVVRIRFAVASFVIGLGATAGWSSPASAYPPSQQTSIAVESAVVDPCGSTAVNGSGFQSGEAVTITLSGTATALDTTTADTTGSFSAQTTIPSGTAPGPYTLLSSGSSGDSASTGITVGTGGCRTVAAVSRGGLAFTGADIAAMVGVAVVSIGVGALLVLTTRRRRQSIN
jgi:hypothetical protein